MPLFIKDDATAALVSELATQRGVTKQAAVKMAVEAELARMKTSLPLSERLAALRRRHLLPPSTGRKADKAFFDDLSGNL